MGNNNLKRIEAFFDGELNSEEWTQFESDLKSDTILASDFVLFQETHKFILEYKNKSDYKKLVDEVHHQYISKFNIAESGNLKNDTSVKKKNFSAYIYWSAAAVLVFVLVVAVLKLANNKKSNEELFAENYQSQEPLNLRSTDSIQQNSVSKCMNEYSSKNFSEAFQCFQQQLIVDKGNNICNFYAGISCIELHNFNKALLFFNRLVQSNDFTFKESSLWYSGLCYLKINNTDSALICFQKLNVENGFYNEKTEKIMKELR